MRWQVKAAAAVAASMMLVGCATHSTNPQDPYEGFNRTVFKMNKRMDSIVLQPVTKAYRWAVPEVGRTAINNTFKNLNMPATAVNHALTGEGEKTLVSTLRFLINLTFGLGGTIDMASAMGIKEFPTDMGQTLATWGVKQGPYLVLPLLGPTTTRDVWQWPLEASTNVGTWALWSEPFAAKAGYAAGEAINVRNNLMNAGADEMLADALDEYTAVRNAYLQHRQFLLEQRGIVTATPEAKPQQKWLPLDLNE